MDVKTSSKSFSDFVSLRSSKGRSPEIGHNIKGYLSKK